MYVIWILFLKRMQYREKPENYPHAIMSLLIVRGEELP